MKLTESFNIIKPKRLKQGDLIGITAPSSQINSQAVSTFVKFLEENGFKVLLGDTITTVKDRDYNAGTARERADDLNAMFGDKNVRAVFAGAGGFGAQKIAHYIDYTLIERDPKPVIGFSDTTFLLNAIQLKTGIGTFLGPTAEILDINKDAKSLKMCFGFLTGELEGDVLIQNLDGSMTRRVSVPEVKNGTGRLIGGNLTMAQTTLGTDFEVDTKGKIILLEEVGESSYSIERSLDHLFSAGKFDECAGVVFGEFISVSREPVKDAHDSNPSVNEIIVKKFKHADYPVLMGYNFSHGAYNLTLPIGCIAVVSSRDRSLKVVDTVVK